MQPFIMYMNRLVVCTIRYLAANKDYSSLILLQFFRIFEK